LFATQYKRRKFFIIFYNSMCRWLSNNSILAIWASDLRSFPLLVCVLWWPVQNFTILIPCAADKLIIVSFLFELVTSFFSSVGMCLEMILSSDKKF
jgi:hypothetical protein